MTKRKKYIVLVSVARDGNIDLLRYILESSSKELAEMKALNLAKKHYPEYREFRIIDTEEQT